MNYSYLTFGEYRTKYPYSPLSTYDFPPEENMKTIFEYPELFNNQESMIDYEL